MNIPAKLIYRKLLQRADPEAFDGISGSGSSSELRRPLNPVTTFNSSIALNVLVLLVVIFFLGFFSVYIRRFVAAPSNNHPSPPSTRRPYLSNQKRGGGLDPSVVSSLPLVAFDKAAKHQMIDTCPICLSEFHESESIKLIPHCGHVFHPECVDTWLLSHVTCPLCRSAQLFKRAEEVRLNVARDNDICEGFRVGDGDTWRDREVGGVRRICSCSNLANHNHSVLRRSISF